MKRDQVWIVAKLSTALLLLAAVAFMVMLYIGSTYERSLWANTPLNLAKKRKLQEQQKQAILDSRISGRDGNVEKIPAQ